MKYTKISQSYHKIKICETKRKKDYCYAGGFWHTGGATETQYIQRTIEKNKQKSGV